MKAATVPRDDPRTTRLLHVDPARGEISDHHVGDLVDLLRAGDVLIVNDAATLPAMLHGVASSGADVEVRLAGEREDGDWRAVLFGAGDWRLRTEDRPPPPALRPGDSIEFDGLRATVQRVEDASGRLVSLAFAGRADDLWPRLYRAGRPVQYSYAARPFALWDVQTAYAGRPWAVEPPSAGLALTWDLLLALRRRGVALARVTHAAGLSSTGETSLDAQLPFRERYAVPVGTVRAIEEARRRGGRVVAVGTTVVRALEGAAAGHGGELVPGEGTTELIVGPGTARHVVDAVLTGMHEPGSSHFVLLQAFAPLALLEEARRVAAEHGYLDHEFGDLTLVLDSATAV